MNPDGERVAVVLNKTDEDVPVVLRERKGMPPDREGREHLNASV